MPSTKHDDSDALVVEALVLDRRAGEGLQRVVTEPVRSSTREVIQQTDAAISAGLQKGSQPK